MTSLSTQRDVKAGVFSGPGMVPVILLTLTLSACAGLGPRSAEEAVKQRSQSRWNALVKGDVSEAYSYLTSGSRAVVTLPDFEASIRKGFWKSALVQGVTCSSPEACEATVVIEYDFKGRRTKGPLRETWIREGSDWRYLYR